MTSPHYADEHVQLWHGDCINIMANMPDNSIDAIITDPPYGLANTTPEQVTETITQWISGDLTPVVIPRRQRRIKQTDIDALLAKGQA